MADFDSLQPVRTTATNFTTEVANASGTTINPVEEFAQGSTTSGQSGALTLGAATTSAPTYSTGTTNPLSLDTSGNLRVTFAGSGEQNVNLNQVGGVAVALGQTTESASIPVTIASNQSPLSVNETQLNGVSLGSPSNYGTSPGAVEVQGVNAFITNTVPVTLASTTITGTVAVTQSTSPWVISGTVTTTPPANASTNLTEVGGSVIALGQTTMAASIPVVFASNQTPLNVNVGGGVTPVVTFATTASVASSGTATQTVSGPIILDAIHATASGEIKVLIAIGVTGSEVTQYVGFTSASNKNFDWNLKDPITIPTGSDVKITITNKDTAAMDVYSTVVSH